jgi:zinc protease
MVKYNRFCLENGLRVLVHEDRSSPLVAMNVLYDVGSRDEDPEATGLAHLFEHLMF